MRRQARKHAIPWLLAGVWLVLLLLHEAAFLRLGFVERLDAALYDLSLKSSAPRGADDRITILDIDEASLKAVGRWPWSRDKMAALVDKLYNDYGIAAMGFDVIFAEPDISSGIATLDQLAKKELSADPQFLKRYAHLRPALDYDGRFAETLGGKTLALGYYFITPGLPAGVTGALPPPNLPASALGEYGGRLVEAKQRRMKMVAVNGLLVLLPSALLLARWASAGRLDAGFYALQGLELVAGATNITLLALNLRDGRRLAGRR